MSATSQAAQSVFDVLDPARARALQATLGLSPSIEQGDALPPFFHQAHFWDARVAGDLGEDGHPKLGVGLIPQMGLPRRMWAGGRVEFHRPLCAGTPAERRSFRESVESKSGRSGALAFVTLRHEIHQDGDLRVTEWQRLVYREAGAAAPAASMAPGDEDVRETARFDATMLFRYSALTFNGHRIHYDLEHATKTEGYGGLVVHGPLLAQMLMLLAERQGGPMASFEFRATSALTGAEAAELCWKRDGTCWVRGPDGRLCMEARAG